MKHAAAILLALSPLCISSSSCKVSPQSTDSKPLPQHEAGSDPWSGFESSTAPGRAPARGEIVTDVNGNGVEDTLDIADGTSLDEDLNGIPDEVDAMFSDPR